MCVRCSSQSHILTSTVPEEVITAFTKFIKERDIFAVIDEVWYDYTTSYKCVVTFVREGFDEDVTVYKYEKPK